MIEILGRKYFLIISCVLFSVMFAIVMFFINPSIDGGSGVDLLRLQLSFDKEKGLEIIKGWGKEGVENFKNYIAMDYIYAFTYVVFLSSIISFLSIKREEFPYFKSKMVVFLVFISGSFDWIENTLEVIFLHYADIYPDWLFSLHSVFASLKWGLVAVAIVYALTLVGTKKITRQKEI